MPCQRSVCPVEHGRSCSHVRRLMRAACTSGHSLDSEPTTPTYEDEGISSSAPPHPESDHCRLKEILHQYNLPSSSQLNGSNAIPVGNPANLAGNLCRHRQIVCAMRMRPATAPRRRSTAGPVTTRKPSRQSWWHTQPEISCTCCALLGKGIPSCPGCSAVAPPEYS